MTIKTELILTEEISKQVQVWVIPIKWWYGW
jgi:hypothetical protein